MRKKPTKRETVLMIGLALILLIAALTRKKCWDYEKVMHIDYNEPYNEKYPIIDTLLPYYKNVNPIFIREYIIGGHKIIGSINGGSLVVDIHDIPNCEKCNKYFLSLQGDG